MRATRSVVSASRGSSSERSRSDCGSRQRVGHSLDPRLRGRRDVDRELAPVELREDHAELAHGAAADADGGVAAGSAHDAAQPADLLLGHLDRVEAPAAEVDGGAAELAERVADPLELLRMLLDEKSRPEVAAVLLVAQHREHEVAGRRPLRVRADERVHEHGDAGLHVERTATPDHPVVDVRGERRMRPLLAGGGDHVDVSVEQQRRRLAAAGDAGDQVRPAVRAREDARVDPGAGEQTAHVLDARGLVPWRVRRVEPDQLAQQLDDVRRLGAHSSSSAASSRSTSAAVL